MPKSLRAQVDELSRLVAARTAAEVPITVDLVTCDTREEALALQAMPPTPPPLAARVRLTARNISAAEYLAGTAGQ